MQSDLEKRQIFARENKPFAIDIGGGFWYTLLTD
jgi:hypothetical protein